MTERLAAVNLQDDGDVPVKGFSGGMVCSRPACPIAPCCRHVTPCVPLRSPPFVQQKRRLSVAISSMGSPQLIVLGALLPHLMSRSYAPHVWLCVVSVCTLAAHLQMSPAPAWTRCPSAARGS